MPDPQNNQPAPQPLEQEKSSDGKLIEKTADGAIDLRKTIEPIEQRTESDILEEEESEENIPLDKSKYYRDKYELDYDDLFKTWQETKDKDRSVEHEITIHELETERPGICKTLVKEFGIKNFDRYPMKVLIKQYDERNNLDIPYGIVIQPYSDWNGSFSSLRNWDLFEDLSKQLNDTGYTMRIFEAGNNIDLARALVNSNRKYGQKHKIAFAFIGGHGTKDTIRFGEHALKGEYLREKLDWFDIVMGKGTQRTAHKFFEENPTIILRSCSTGAANGIGQELSKIGYGGTKVIAPDRSTSINSIKVSQDPDGHLQFGVEYDEKDSKQPKVEYVGGKRVS